MGIVDCFYHSFPIFLKNHKPEHSNISTVATASKIRKKVNLASSKTSICFCASSKSVAILMGAAGMTLISIVGSSHAADSLILNEPSNALSLPTWAVHVSSVVEWATAMALVWHYGEKPGYESWKGLSWGMVPLLGGALCACTWHFFYNSESLEVLVALQAALTVIGNATMCIAAYRIYTSFQDRPKDW